MIEFGNVTRGLSEGKFLDLPLIYCDLDGVLVNLMKGANELILPLYPNVKDWTEVDKEERWKVISGKKDFWKNLEFMPNGIRLWNFIKPYNPNILSAYSKRDVNSKRDKLLWVTKNLGRLPRKNILIVLRKDKKRFAVSDGTPNILIDDYDKNINEWKNAGGIGILHKSIPNTIGELKKLGFK